MNDNVSRREFFVCIGKLLAAGIIAPIGSQAVLQETALAEQLLKGDKWSEVWKDKEWGFVVDTRKCIGCGKCVSACKKENGVPENDPVFRTWVERYVEDEDGEVQIDSPRGGINFPTLHETKGKQFFVPKLCNQCHNPPCVQVCPVGATFKTGDGVILMDEKRCVGCRYCIQACPYGARFLHPVTKVADKCTWCYHRVVKGMLPACVQVCPAKARKFGNLKEPEGIAKDIETNRIRTLKPDMGTKPYVYYIGLDEVVK